MKEHWEKLNQKQHLFKYGSIKTTKFNLVNVPVGVQHPVSSPMPPRWRHFH